MGKRTYAIVLLVCSLLFSGYVERQEIDVSNDEGRTVQVNDEFRKIYDQVNENTTDIVPSGIIVMWSGTIANIPSGYVLCNGENGTPDLTDRFIIHADADSGGTNDVGDTGGADTADLSHTHTAAAHTHEQNSGGSVTGVGTEITIYASSTDNNRMFSGAGGGENTRTQMNSGVQSSGGDATGSAGSATQDITPKYYALAFIMRT